MSDEPRWARRFRTPLILPPQWARDAPDRAVYRSTASGVLEVYAWDRSTGTHRQVTDRPQGTQSAAVSRDGRWVWWFADTDGDEYGVWMREPFDGSAPAEPAFATLGPGYPVGLVPGATVTVVGVSGADGVTVRAGDTVVYSSPRDASVCALNADETLLAVEHSENSDSRHRAVRVLDLDGKTVGDISDPHGLSVVDFAPTDNRLLLTHDRHGKHELLLWEPVTGYGAEVRVDLPGEVSASWYPDGRSLLLTHSHHARDELYQLDLNTGALARLDTPRGVIDAAAVRPDGDVEYRWSSAEHGPVVRRLDGTVLLGAHAPDAAPLEDHWVAGVHVLLSRPAGEGPYPTIFYLHGGPDAQDVDRYHPGRSAFVDSGYCVVHVNYRGSHGYGTAWRDALVGNPGRPELEDTAAVYDWAVAAGIADPARCVLGGASWGGYLTLLGLGTQPERWAAGLALVPIGDFHTLHADATEMLRDYNLALFGGGPEERPEVWTDASPITHVDHVRAPVLITAGDNDPRCSTRQIDNYVRRLAERGAVHEVYRFDAGHFSVVITERIAQAALQLDFLERHLPR
ncbi:prolyl oligopeptidase family serine peptidase [Longispora urticae]